MLLCACVLNRSIGCILHCIDTDAPIPNEQVASSLAVFAWSGGAAIWGQEWKPPPRPAASREGGGGKDTRAFVVVRPWVRRRAGREMGGAQCWLPHPFHRPSALCLFCDRHTRRGMHACFRAEQDNKANRRHTSSHNRGRNGSPSHRSLTTPPSTNPTGPNHKTNPQHQAAMFQVTTHRRLNAFS